jgi:hypothetical protein
MTVQASVLSVTRRFLPMAITYKMLGMSKSYVDKIVKVKECPIVIREAPKVVEVVTRHTCWEYMEEYDSDGCSPAEYCEQCQREMQEYNIKEQKKLEKAKRSSDATGFGMSWTAVQDYNREEQALYVAGDIGFLMELDNTRSSMRPWWYYEEALELSRTKKKDVDEELRASLEKFKEFKANQEKHGYWFEPEVVKAEKEKAMKELKKYQAKLKGLKKVAMPFDIREEIQSFDNRSGEAREADFNKWLAIPKNKRPVYMNGGRMGDPAKAGLGSVVVKKCPVSVLLWDIRYIMAKFGPVRDVYRPRDKVTGKSKPFVFVEMVKNEDAWSAADQFAEEPLVLDENIFQVEGAGERKTTEEMAARPVVEETKVEAIVVEKKVEKKATKATGAFAALADSDSDDE